jgi:hypothetical protein
MNLKEKRGKKRERKKLIGGQRCFIYMHQTTMKTEALCFKHRHRIHHSIAKIHRKLRLKNADATHTPTYFPCLFTPIPPNKITFIVLNKSNSILFFKIEH